MHLAQHVYVVSVPPSLPPPLPPTVCHVSHKREEGKGRGHTERTFLSCGRPTGDGQRTLGQSELQTKAAIVHYTTLTTIRNGTSIGLQVRCGTKQAIVLYRYTTECDSHDSRLSPVTPVLNAVRYRTLYGTVVHTCHLQTGRAQTYSATRVASKIIKTVPSCILAPSRLVSSRLA